MKVSVKIEGVEFRMEVDTGVAASILYYTDYERYFKYLAVRPSRNIILLLVVTNFYFTQDEMTIILFVFHWYQIGHAVVHHYVSVFGMLAHWKPKYRRHAILCCLVVLIFYLWLNRGLPRTIVLPLPTSRIHLRITLSVIARKGLHVSRN